MHRLLIIVLAAAGLAGCSASVSIGGGLDIGKLERGIAKTLLTNFHVHTRVVCPKSPDEKKGVQFTCVAHLAVGSYRELVTERDDDGHVHYVGQGPFNLLRTPKLERALVGIGGSNPKATVHCPSPILQRRGVNFSCTLTLGARHRRIDVVQKDDEGNVHAELR